MNETAPSSAASACSKVPEAPPEPQQSPPGSQPTSPVNPDPKAHPIHAPIPVQPIHEGTDPKTPVTPGDTLRDEVSRGAPSRGSVRERSSS
jgi:hypothetical protein